MNSPEKPIVCLTAVRWRDVGEPSTTEPYWTFNTTCPKAGELRFASIYRSDTSPLGAIQMGQKRWLLFQPAYSYLNDFDETNLPDLDLCAVVEVEILGVAPHYWRMFDGLGKQHIWVECRCLQVVPLAQIPDVFPPMFVGKRANNLLATHGKTITYFIEQTPEIHNWYMVTNPAATRHAMPHLVLSGDSFDNHCMISNWVIEHDETSWKAA